MSTLETRTAPAAAISYEDLYARWEQGNWSATEIDFTEDARQWREEFTEHERKAALWNYALFFWGEDAVADNLSPVHRRGAAGGAEVLPHHPAGRRGAPRRLLQALHARGRGRRRRHDVGRAGSDQARADVGLSQGVRPPGHDGRRAAQGSLAAEAVGGDDALPHDHRGRRSRSRASTSSPPTWPTATCFPAFREGMENVARDEQRHIGFGVKLLHDLVAEDPRCRAAVADTPARGPPWTRRRARRRPAGTRTTPGLRLHPRRDRRGGLASVETKLRSAGMPLEELPGPPPVPLD